MQRNHMVRYLTQHAGKGQRDSVKRIHKVNEENIIMKTYIDHKVIE